MTRWITSQLGTAPWDHCDRAAENVLVDVRLLRDSAGNPADVIRERIEQALEALRLGRKVIVCCDYGVSRSNAVAAGVLAAYSGIDYDTALAGVIAATSEQRIKLDFVSDVRAALGEPPRRTADSGTFIIGRDGFMGRALQRALGLEEPGDDLVAGDALAANPVLLDTQLGALAPKQLLFCWHPSQLDTNDAAGTLITCLRNVLEVCRLRRLDFVFISGHQVFSARLDEEIRRCSEEENPQPSGAAGDGLYLAEQLIRLYASRDGLHTLIVRPTHLYGAGDRRPSFLNTFLRKALSGVTIETHVFSNGAPYVDVLHVDDFARGVALALARGLRGVLHLASGHALTTETLANEVVRLANRGGLTRTIALPGICTRTLLDPSLAQDTLAWSPDIALSDGLHEALSHIRINTDDTEGTLSK